MYFWPEEPSGCFRPNFLVVSIDVHTDSVLGAYFLDSANHLGLTTVYQNSNLMNLLYSILAKVGIESRQNFLSKSAGHFLIATDFSFGRQVSFLRTEHKCVPHNNETVCYQDHQYSRVQHLQFPSVKYLINKMLPSSEYEYEYANYAMLCSIP